jgi:hypothetical protein
VICLAVGFSNLESQIADRRDFPSCLSAGFSNIESQIADRRDLPGGRRWSAT